MLGLQQQEGVTKLNSLLKRTLEQICLRPYALAERRNIVGTDEEAMPGHKKSQRLLGIVALDGGFLFYVV